MADVSYILGTGEYVRVEITDESLDESWSPTGWTYELLLPLGQAYDEASAVWVAAAYEAVTDTQGETRHTVVAKLSALTDAVGIYLPRVRMTHPTDAESPVPLKAAGKVTVEL